ncbi:MAG: hypothetical protein KC443_09730 [Anaerolineales bacterium]|nr:hypothetical protein [Anaerolineales bacterium]
MNTSDTQSRKYTIIAVAIIASLFMMGFIGLYILQLSPRQAPIQHIQETSESLPQVTLSLQNEIDEEIESTNTSDEIEEPKVTATITYTETLYPIKSNSIQIIAPLLSYSEEITPEQTYAYLFEAVVNAPLQITLETTYELRFEAEILDSKEKSMFKEEYGRGIHMITFTPEQSGEFIIRITGVSNTGIYNISMDFAEN